jgi:hypothetical protein
VIDELTAALLKPRSGEEGRPFLHMSTADSQSRLI